MIFDDLKNITFYKGLHPNLDKAIDYLYEHRKDAFRFGKYDIDGDKVFLVVQENVLNQEENDRFEYHKNYADLHLLVEGHEYSSYGSRVKDEAVAFDEASDIGILFTVTNNTHFCWVITILQSSSQGSLINRTVMQAWKIRFASICLKF